MSPNKRSGALAPLILEIVRLMARSVLSGSIFFLDAGVCCVKLDICLIFNTSPPISFGVGLYSLFRISYKITSLFLINSVLSTTKEHDYTYL
jgi:hypothetical protein